MGRKKNKYLLPEERKIFGEHTRNIRLMHKYGFYPLYATRIYFETTYIFRTEREALKAFDWFEKNPRNKKEIIQGWWYGKKNWFEILDKEFREGAIERSSIDIMFINPYKKEIWKN